MPEDFFELTLSSTTFEKVGELYRVIIFYSDRSHCILISLDSVYLKYEICYSVLTAVSEKDLVTVSHIFL